MFRNYQVCVKQFLGFCREWKKEVEFYDFTKREDRMKFIQSNFVLQAREKPI